MLFCNDCKTSFREMDLKREKVNLTEYMGRLEWETQSFCPRCGSWDYTEATECDSCGRYFPDDQVYLVNDYLFCERCLEKHLRIHSAAVAKFFINNKDWIEELNEYIKEER